MNWPHPPFLWYTSSMENNDIVYGVHAVTEALQANTGNKLYIQEDLRGKNVDKIKALAAEKSVDFLDAKENPAGNDRRSCSPRLRSSSGSLCLHRLSSDSETDSQRREPAFIDSRWFNGSAQSWIYLTDS